MSALASSCVWTRQPPPEMTPGIEAAGVHLPLNVGPYVASLVQYGGDPLQGALVRYAPDDSTSSLPRIDVIVYPAEGAWLSVAIRRSHDALLEIDRTSAQIANTTLLDERLLPIEAVDDTAYRATYYIAVDDSPRRSLIYLHRSGAQVLKAQASFPLHPGFDPEDRLDDVVSALFAVAGARR